jgi:hypothetical protein
MVKKSRNLLAVLAALLLVLGMVASASAHAIDYTAYDIQPQLNFDGKSGNFRLIDPVAPNSIFSFRLTLELIESAGGGTSALPVTVTFGVKNSVPHDLMVGFGEGTLDTISTLPATIAQKYEKVSGQIKSLQTAVTVKTPATPGSYFFKIQAIAGYKGLGLQPGEGIVVHFKVADQVVQPIETLLDVTLASSNMLYRTPTNIITATLTEKTSGAGVAGKPINFYLDGVQLNELPIATDVNGKADFTYNNTSSTNLNGLAVGDYTFAAKFEGASDFGPSSGSTNQCVTYKWLGFQPPVLVQDPVTLGLGVGLFQGKVIPVKFKIADFEGKAVANAEARLYWAKTNTGVIDTPAVGIQSTTPDNTNLMRYDAATDQYILNWNISTFVNGDYNIRVGLEEGECATGHWVPVRIGKASK